MGRYGFLLFRGLFLAKSRFEIIIQNDDKSARVRGCRLRDGSCGDATKYGSEDAL